MSEAIANTSLWDQSNPPDRAGNLVLVNGDLEIFRLVYEFRFLRREQICALSGRPPKRLHRRLLKLVQHRYLMTIRLPQQKHIYGIGKAAFPILVEQGLGPEELLAFRIRTRELKPLFLNHEMMIVDIHVALSKAMEGNALNLIGWKEGRELFDTVTVPGENGVEQLPVRPDAFFSIRDSRRPEGANCAYFFLEADRSTETHSRFKDKIRAYLHYIAQGLHNKKFNIKSFRVVTLTLTEARAFNLTELAASILPEWARKYFLFGTVKHFTLDNPNPILEEIFYRPGFGNTRFPLAPRREAK